MAAQERYTNSRFGGGPVTPQPWDFDVAVIGAGPAGSSAATTLARRGHRVLALDREQFPRFHIGESQLPCLNDVLDTLGRQGGHRRRRVRAEVGRQLHHRRRQRGTLRRLLPGRRSGAAADLSGASRAVRPHPARPRRRLRRHGETRLPGRRRGLRARRRDADLLRGRTVDHGAGGRHHRRLGALRVPEPPVRHPRARPAAPEHRRPSPVHRGAAGRRAGAPATSAW